LDYRVEELARAARISVDTVRFYQARGLISPPVRRGRVAVYGESHLEQIARIRRLNSDGLTLGAIRRLLEREARRGAPASNALLEALDEVDGERTFTRAELASAAGLPEVLIAQAEQAGLFHPLQRDGQTRYTEADRRSAESARTLLETGLPIAELLPIALEHAANMEATIDRCLDLFSTHVRHDSAGERRDSDEVMHAFRELLPAATTLVALHFQRTLIHRARQRLETSGDLEDLHAALSATESSRLRVSWG
jgi:DNA-binding transcriptional MerR regulator